MIDIQGINILACPKQKAGSIDNARSNNDHKRAWTNIQILSEI